jgi:SAM-dependent methyltransferase
MKSDNINTAEYWDSVHSKNEVWRTYPTTFEYICNEVGEFKTVVEFGCGTGFLAVLLAKNFNTVFGYDISKEAITKFNTNNFESAFGCQCDLLKVEKVVMGNIAVATEFLEHFTNEELKIIMPKIVRSCPKAIFCVPNDCLGNDVCKEHYQKWNKESFRKFLQEYYVDAVVFSFIEKYTAKDNTYIELPVLMAVCWRNSK